LKRSALARLPDQRIESLSSQTMDKSQGGLIMAAKAKPLPQEIGQVRIPALLLTSLNHFLNSLQRPILNEAAARAFDRKSGPAAGRVTLDDIVQAAQKILPSSLAEVAESLQSCETRHARQKAS
jgi:hypothetical protein